MRRAFMGVTFNSLCVLVWLSSGCHVSFTATWLDGDYMAIIIAHQIVIPSCEFDWRPDSAEVLALLSRSLVCC